MGRRGKIISYFFLALLLIILGLYLGIFHLGGMEYIVNRELTEAIEGKYKASLHIGEINGDFINFLEIKDIVIFYDDGTVNYEIARISRLIAEYDAYDLWQGQIRFKKIFIDSAVIVIRKTREGGWLIPQAIEKGPEAQSPFDLELSELGLNNLNLRLEFPEDTLAFENIMVTAHLAIHDNTYALAIDALSYISSDERLTISSGGGKATIAGNNIVFENLTVTTPSSQVGLSGQAVLQKNPSAHIIFDSPSLDLEDIGSFLGAKLNGNVAAQGIVNLEGGKISGTVDISGKFMGRNFDSLKADFTYKDKIITFDSLNGYILKGCLIEASGRLNLGSHPESYFLTGNLRHFNLNNLVEGTFESDLGGLIRLEGRGLNSKNLTIELTAALEEPLFDEYDASFAAGEMTITTDSIIFKEGFQLRYGNNLFYASGKIEYDGLIDIGGYTDLGDLSAFNNRLFIEEMGGRGRFDFRFSGKVKNPDLAGILISDSLWIYGVYATQAKIDFAMKNFLYDRVGQATAYLDSGHVYDFPMDSAFLVMEIDSQTVRFTSLDFYNEYTTAYADGNLRYDIYPQVLNIDNLIMSLFEQGLRNDSRIEIEIDSLGYEFSEFKLVSPGGFIGWEGRINTDESLDLVLSAGNINITPWVELFDRELDITGFLSGDMDISGTFDSPQIRFDGRVDSIFYKGLFLGNMLAACDYSERAIIIDSVDIRSPQGRYLARGRYPIDLSLTEVANRFPEENQDIVITASDLRLDLVSLMFDEVDELTGDFGADFRLTGTPLKPRINGTASLKNGKLKLYDLVLPLENLDLVLQMEGKTISIVSASATCNNGKKQTGTVATTGIITLLTADSLDYDLKIMLRNFPAHYELGDIKALADADLTLSGATPPLAAGDVRIIEAQWRENFAEKDQGWVVMSELEAEKSWNLNLNAEFVSNVWIKNDDIDAELGGTINLVRETGTYKFIGDLEIIRGKAYAAGRAFRIEQGSTISYESIEYPNPRLDILASTRIRGSGLDPISGEAINENYDLMVKVTGTLDEPIINAAEDSRFTTEEIATLLFTDYAGSTDGNSQGFQMEDRIFTGLSDALSTEVSRFGSRTLGVETLEIEPVYGQRFDPRVTLGFYTLPSLYVYGRSGVTGTVGQEVGFEYRLKKFMVLEGRVNEQNLYDLLMNFRWEY